MSVGRSDRSLAVRSFLPCVLTSAAGMATSRKTQAARKHAFANPRPCEKRDDDGDIIAVLLGPPLFRYRTENKGK